MNPLPDRKRRQEKTVRELIANSFAKLSRQISALNKLQQAPVPLFVRSDREATRICGFKSAWRFSEWAKRHGLKPKMKFNARKRTTYRVSDLIKACDADIAQEGREYDAVLRGQYIVPPPVPSGPHGQAEWHRLRSRGRSRGDE